MANDQITQGNEMTVETLESQEYLTTQEVIARSLVDRKVLTMGDPLILLEQEGCPEGFLGIT